MKCIVMSYFCICIDIQRCCEIHKLNSIGDASPHRCDDNDFFKLGLKGALSREESFADIRELRGTILD